ncbi:MAG: hypothetical protein AAGJ94_15735 [Pseudomonadota bacterium]
MAKVEIAHRAAENAEKHVTPDDITAWRCVNGDLPEQFIIATDSGWGTLRLGHTPAGAHSGCGALRLARTPAVAHSG